MNRGGTTYFAALTTQKRTDPTNHSHLLALEFAKSAEFRKFNTFKGDTTFLNYSIFDKDIPDNTHLDDFFRYISPLNNTRMIQTLSR